MDAKPRSGVKKEADFYMVEFYEYNGILSVCGKDKKIPQSAFYAINENVALPLRSKDEAAKKVNGKWIYIFKKIGDNKASLVREIYPEVNNDKQTYKMVSWTDEKKWESVYPRELEQKSFNAIMLFSDFDYFVFLSTIQLPIKRINDLAMNAEKKLRPRSTYIYNRHTDDVVKVNLLDYKTIAGRLLDNALRKNNGLEEYSNNVEQTKRAYLVEAIHSIAESTPKMKKWLKYPACMDERNSYIQQINSLKYNKGLAVSRLASFLLSSGYTEMLDDHHGNEKIEMSIFDSHAANISIMDSDKAGLEYLAEVASDSESWLSRFFLEEHRFLVQRKFVTLVNESENAHVFLKQYIVGIAAKRFPPGVKVTEETIIKIEMEIIAKVEWIFEKYGIEPTGLAQQAKGKYFTVYRNRLTNVINIRYKVTMNVENRIYREADFSKYQEWHEKFKEGFEKLEGAIAAVALAFEIINTILAYKALTRADHEEAAMVKIRLVGAVADSIFATKFLLEKFSKAKSGILKILGKAGVRIIPVFGVIHAVCDFVEAFEGMEKAGVDRNAGQFAGSLIICASSVFTAGAGVAALGSAAWAEVASALGVIGIALFLVGATLIWIFTEEELEKWAKRSEWAFDKIGEWSVDQQIHELHKILCQFKAECYYNRVTRSKTANSGDSWNYTLTIGIIHGLINDVMSKFKIEIAFEQSDALKKLLHPLSPDKLIVKRSLSLSNENTIVIHEKDKPYRLIYRFPESDQSLLSNYVGQLRYEMNSQLDFHGDGKTKFPEKPMFEKLFVGVKENDEEILPVIQAM